MERVPYSRRRMLAVARKEWTHLRRDPQALAVIALLPVITLVLYGYAINFDLKRIPLGIVDHDRSPQSRALRETFESTEYFRFAGELADERAVEGAFERDMLRVVIVIPYGFARDIGAGRTARLQAIYDGSDGTTAGIAISYASAQVGEFARRLGADAALHRAPRAARGQPGIAVASRMLYNPELNSTNFIVPGLLVLVLGITSALLTSTTIARERERGTLESLVVTPIQPLELMAGKLLPYVFAGMADVALLVVIGWGLFGVWPAGSLALLFAGMLIFLAGVLGLGILISTVARNQVFALQMGFLATLLPTLLLSGFAYPRQSMPAQLYYLTALLMPTQFLIFVRAIYLKGSGLSLLWPQLLWLTLMAAFFLRAAAKRFVKRLD